jgi:hypothetical protein
VVAVVVVAVVVAPKAGDFNPQLESTVVVAVGEEG